MLLPAYYLISSSGEEAQNLNNYMERPSYLQKYIFDWELLDVMIGGRSSMDTKFFITSFYNKDDINDFLKNYGLDPADPITKAELYGNFQESIQFIRRFLIKPGNPDGIDLAIPEIFNTITDVNEVFFMATGSMRNVSKEQRYWAEVILKVMHTVVHIDKDLRSNYFPTIQTQIFDRFYKYIYRSHDKGLFLGDRSKDSESIPLVDFETKARKSRDSVTIKLLHKAESVAEELFDRIGVRFITENKLDAIRVCKFLLEKNIVIPHNVKPSRSLNSLIDFKKFKEKHQNILKMAIRNQLSEDRFQHAMERELKECIFDKMDDAQNNHSLKAYKSIQFTGRQLIKYHNTFFKDFYELKKSAKESNSDPELVKKIMNMDMSLIAKDIRFFYPFEVQIMDRETFVENTKGDASHSEYKKTQVKSVIKRLFWALIKNKEIDY